MAAVRWVLPVSVHTAALLVAWAAGLAAAWGVFALAGRLYGRRAGVVAAVLWGVVPYAVIESMAYSESLFTALAVWALYATVTRRWLWAGTLCALAGLTRPTGIALVGAIGVAALCAAVRGGPTAGGGRWRPVTAMLLAPLGFFGYLAWVGAREGRWDGYFRVQEAWQSHLDFGLSTWETVRNLLTHAEPVWLTDLVVLVTLVAGVLLFAVSVRERQALPLLLFSAAVLFLALGDAAYFSSRARFLLPAVGLLFPLASGLARVRTTGVLVMVLGAGALCSAVYGAHVLLVYPYSP
ncbi:glycosyltransferase family 39 protein [Kitasatospora saccharophila]|uniref:glycosyltransferase family 39 protein n=1 Tax=Kitasatospora saccharophila TaxID=407973 RepID=UPI00363C9053